MLFSRINTAAVAQTQAGLPPRAPFSDPSYTSTPTDLLTSPQILIITQRISSARLPVPRPTTNLYCSQDTPVDIPDNDSAGITSSIQVKQPGTVQDVNLFLKVNHTWPGDLEIVLVHQESGIRVNLIDRPGIPATSQGCGQARIQSILDDEASQLVENKCGSYPAGIAGIFQPSEPLAKVKEQRTTGEWTLNVLDHTRFDTGNLQEWCLEITSGERNVTPTLTPLPIALPSSAYVVGVKGKDQASPLDCESRTAVDWAEFFGLSIPELEFYNRLPRSDNPAKGFVGSVNGVWGKIPPDDYGVHAEPVAALLRDYGLKARAYHSLRWDDIRAEIALGQPVIAWVTGHAYAGKYPSGAPQYYTSASDQSYTVVANYEHTVMITGYTSSSVTIQDGSATYIRKLNEFLDSWSALRNMAILAHP